MMSNLTSSPIICAIDTRERHRAKSLISEVSSHVGLIKLGLEFFCANGPEGIDDVLPLETPLFLDLKLHDIPNTVAHSIESLATVNPAMLTIHTSGGGDMMKRACEVASSVMPQTLLLGVTVLTSLNEEALRNIGISDDAESQVLRLVELGIKNGLRGFVCSAHELVAIRKNFGQDIKLVVPGIRPEGSDTQDQKRVMTPKQALDAGADYLVIGRPITQSDNPAEAARNIAETINV